MSTWSRPSTGGPSAAEPSSLPSPHGATRDTRYGTHRPGTDDSLSRSLPILSLDSGLVLERDTGSKEQRLQTLEPRLLYLYVPYRGQDQIPVFDTALPDLNIVQLFRTNRYVGADRVGDANQLSIGVTSRLLDARGGRQFLSATLGQAFYFENPQVRLPDEPVRDLSTSDVIAELELAAFKNWNGRLGFQWNPDEARTETSAVVASAEVEVIDKKEGKRGGTVTYKWTVKNQEEKVIEQGVNT